MKTPFNFTKNKRTKKDILVMFIIISLPFIFYLYNFVPKTKRWTTSLFEVNSGYYEDANFYFWLLNVKILTLLILSIWYVTCKYRWRFILLVPILLEIYKIFINIKVASIGFDHQIEFSVSLIYSIPYLLLLFVIDRFFGYYQQAKSFNVEVNMEINNQLNKLSKFDLRKYKDVKRELSLLTLKRKEMDKKEYLSKLIILRDKITI